jgi:hypothetical protein
MGQKTWIGVALALACAVSPISTDRARADVPNSPGPSVAAPPGYRVVNSTDFGQALACPKPSASSVSAALSNTINDLSRYFGARLTVRTAYEDTKDHRSGGAAFAVSVRGQPVKGLIVCRLGTTGANVAVVYARPDTPPAEWRRLMSAPAQAGEPSDAATQASAVPAQGTGTPLPPPAKAPLREYAMPDGTGSVGLAEGWSTRSPSLMRGVVLEGPADQRVSIMMTIPVHTPGSPMAAMLQRSGRPVFLAPFSSPLEAFATLIPEISEANRRAGGPTVEVDHLAEVARAQPWGPDDRAALLAYGVTETGPAGRRHYRAVAQIHMVPLPGAGTESWSYFATMVRAPDTTFEHDLPLMLELAGSERENAQVIMNKARQNVAASQQRTAQVIDQVHQRTRAFDAWRADNERASNARMRQADDFDETIRGTRTVEDTRTGEKVSVDLGDVDHITDKLNEYDSGRYRQIPLRDEVDPVR